MPFFALVLVSPATLAFSEPDGVERGFKSFIFKSIIELLSLSYRPLDEFRSFSLSNAVIKSVLGLKLSLQHRHEVEILWFPKKWRRRIATGSVGPNSPRAIIGLSPIQCKA
jgi:hypothetical protein